MNFNPQDTSLMNSFLRLWSRLTFELLSMCPDPRRLEKHPFESHFYKMRTTTWSYPSSCKIRHESALMLGDRRYRIATDSAPTSKSAISSSHYSRPLTTNSSKPPAVPHTPPKSNSSSSKRHNPTYGPQRYKISHSVSQVCRGCASFASTMHIRASIL